MNAASIWIGVGVNVLIYRISWEKKQDEANTTVTHGLLLAFGVGALLNLLALLIMKPYFGAFTNNEEIYQLSIAYMSVCSFMQIPNMVHIAIQKMIQATGTWLLLCGSRLQEWSLILYSTHSNFWYWCFPSYGNPLLVLRWLLLQAICYP